MTASRIILFVLSMLMLVVTELGQNVYRPWVFENGIEDYGVADSIGSFGGVFVSVFLFVSVLGRKEVKQAVSVAIGTIIGCVLYEFLQPFLGTGVFDWKDVVGVIFGGAIATCIVRLVCRSPTVGSTG